MRAVRFMGRLLFGQPSSRVVPQVTRYYDTALMRAADETAMRAADDTAMRAADDTAMRDADDTALMLAAKKGHTETVSALLSHGGIDVNAVTRYGSTALMLAAENGHTETVSALLSHGGINVNAVTRYGSTALMLAAENGHTETVSALLSQGGIDVNAVTPDGDTALMLAAKKGHTETVSALLSHGGIDVNAVSRYGSTALMLAAQNGHTETVSTLQSHKLKLTSETLYLASYDPNSNLSKLSHDIMDQVLEFTDTHPLSEKEIKAILEAAKEGAEQTAAYKNFKKLAQANEPTQTRESSLTAGLRAEVMESRTAGELGNSESSHSSSSPSSTVKVEESNSVSGSKGTNKPPERE